MKQVFGIPGLCVVMLLTFRMASGSVLSDNPPSWKFDSVTLTNGGPPATVQRAWIPGRLTRHPVILLLGSLRTNELPEWSTNLVIWQSLVTNTVAADGAVRFTDPNVANRPRTFYRARHVP